MTGKRNRGRTADAPVFRIFSPPQAGEKCSEGTRSHRMKFCVQRGLGNPQQAAPGAGWLSWGIACLFSPKMKRTSERIVKFHSLAQFVSNFSDNSVSSFTVSWV